MDHSIICIHLTSSNLTSSHLTSSHLTSSHLTSSHFTYSHFTYSHFTYSHFTLRPKSGVLPTLSKDMKGSEPEWSNQKQVKSQVISYQVSYVQMLEYPVAGITIYTIIKTLVTSTISGHLSYMPVVYVICYKLHGMLPILIKA